MTTTYYLGPTDSDITGQSGDYSKRLDSTAVGASTLFQTQAAAGTEAIWGVTAAGVPGADGITGTYTVELNIITGVTSSTVRAAVRRINSGGTTQVTSSFTATQAGTAGIKTFTLSSINLGTWAAGDRLVVIYEFTGPGGHGNVSWEFQMGTTDAEVVAPWTTVTTVNGAAVGAVTAAATAAGQTTVVGQAIGAVTATASASGPVTSPQFDAASGGQIDAATSLTFAHTVANQADRVLYVGVQAAEETSTLSVTYNGVAMTSLGARNSNDQTLGKVQLFRLVAPAIGANNVVVSSTEASDLEAESVSYWNADQGTSPTAVTAISATAAVLASIDTASANSRVVGTVCCGDAIAAASSGTTSRRIENNNNLSAAGNGALGDRAGTGGIDAVGFERAVAEWWAIVAVEVLPAAGPVSGSAQGAVVAAGVAVGLRDVFGQALGSVTASGAAAGSTGASGAAQGNVIAAGTAAGQTTTVGAAISGVIAAGTAVGSGTTNGAAAGNVAAAGAAAGEVTTFGSAVSAVTAVAAASGVGGSSGAASGTVTAAATAIGQRTVFGSAAGNVTAAGSAAGTGTSSGAAVSAVTAGGTAAGQTTVTGVAASGVTAAATAAGETIGTAAAAVTAGAIAAGQVTVFGAATAVVNAAAAAIGTGVQVVEGQAVSSVTANGTGAGLQTIPIGINVIGGSSPLRGSRGSSSSGDAAGRTLVGVDVA